MDQEHAVTAEDLRKIPGPPKEPCHLCKVRGKTWKGGDPQCSFGGSGTFDSEGWNCATANAIRDLCSQDEKLDVSDYRYCDDQNYSTIQVDTVDLPSGSGLALWVSWYKHRGGTEAMWILSNYDLPRLPTAADCEAIINALGVRQ